MHRLLVRQIKRHFGKVEDIPADMSTLLQAIDEAYLQADADRAMIEHSLDLASQEMLEQNRALASELAARRAAESQVQRLSNFDELTELANRNLLNECLNQAIASAKGEAPNFAVVVLGLDRFKMVKDSLGQAAGNELLKIVGDRLCSSLRGSDTVARIGDDEFALILINSQQTNINFCQRSPDGHIEANSHLIEILHRILKIVSDTVVLSGHELQVTCSIGVSLFPQDGGDSEALLRTAGAAMSSAKRLGRNNFQFYTADLSAAIETRLAMQGQLRLALDRNEFVLHYQPQVDLCSGCMIGVEALLRWNHPERGLMPPAQFIALAEETGLIVPIGAWAIRSACEQARDWQAAGYANIRMAVNLSIRQFSQPDLVDYIAGVLAQTGLEPQLLEIELTESLVMDNVDRSIDVLRQLKGLGVQISIDDFGTGYSSLAYLKRFPIDLLKIDQSFVRDIGATDSATIVKAIVSMAHSLGIRVIAEGVETETQCDFLRLNMCDEIQGFLFSKPFDAEKVTEMLKQDLRLPDKLLRFEKPKRVLLLVDDEPNITSALTRLVRALNLKVHTANSGQAGLEVLANYRVGVIISDQRMPGMTGVEFLRAAKALYPDTIRMVLSGYTELQSVTAAVNEGAIYKFLTKPWDDQQLLSIIEEAFQYKELADENRRLDLEVRTSNLELATAKKKLEEMLNQRSGHPHLADRYAD